jgi:hypothetical protein
MHFYFSGSVDDGVSAIGFFPHILTGKYEFFPRYCKSVVADPDVDGSLFI